MLEQKDLQMIGALLDEKLDQKLTPIQEDIRELKTDVAALKTDVAGLKTDVAGLKTDVATLKTDVATLKTDVATLKTNFANLDDKVTTLEDKMIQLDQKVDRNYDHIEDVYVTQKEHITEYVPKIIANAADIRYLKARMKTYNDHFYEMAVGYV